MATLKEMYGMLEEEYNRLCDLAFKKYASQGKKNPKTMTKQLDALYDALEALKAGL